MELLETCITPSTPLITSPRKGQEDNTRDPKQHTLPRRTRGLTSTERRRVRSAERGGFASTTPVETKVRVQG